MSAAAIDLGALSSRYAQLDELPEVLFEPALLNPHGQLPVRVAGLLRWRAALLAGDLQSSEELGWPGPELCTPLLNEIRRLDLPRFCKGEAELCDALLLSVLDAVAHGEAELRVRTNDVFARLRREEEERQRIERERKRQLEQRSRDKDGPKQDDKGGHQQGAQDGQKATGGGAAEEPVSLDEKALNRLRTEAEGLARAELPQILSAFIAGKWAERARLWAELSEVFGEVAALLGRGWDLSQGLLRSTGWLEIMRLHEQLKSLPALRELVQTLGRMSHSATDAPSVLEKIFVNVRRVEQERREVRSPLVPMETRGIERSGEIARMLPSEMVLLTHPVLKRLWHARRAERGLVSYRVEGTEWERVGTDETGTEEAEELRRPQQRGPILLCVDTSGSMSGLPEQVAKALALEALRTAHTEKRPLYLYLFSGPNQVAEQELSLAEQGLPRLLALLTLSFHGGTDVVAPLARATQRLAEEAWSRADILLVSDGEFSAPAESVAQLAKARAERGLRVHGVMIGRQDGTAMQALCDPGALHRFTSWADCARPAE